MYFSTHFDILLVNPSSRLGGFSIIMEKYIQEFLGWKATYAIRASVTYRRWLDRFREVVGDRDISDYTTDDYVKYSEFLRRNSYSPSTVQYATIVLKNFFQYFKNKGEKCLSPEIIKVPRVQSKSHCAVTEENFEKIISNIPTSDFRSLRDLLIISLLWDTGMRVSELCDLDVVHIDENQCQTVIGTKKAFKKRIIVWSNQTHNLLMKYMPIRNNLPTMSSALFMGNTRAHGWTHRLTPRSIQRMITHYVRLAGITEKITPHSFRHGWAHKRRDQKAPLSFIQRGLGHQNPVSTFVYNQYTDTDFVKNAASYLE